MRRSSKKRRATTLKDKRMASEIRIRVVCLTTSKSTIDDSIMLLYTMCNSIVACKSMCMRWAILKEESRTYKEGSV